MNFRLMDAGWGKLIEGAITPDCEQLKLICPFIKVSVVKRLLKQAGSKPVQIITRFSGQDFCSGVSDLEALRLFLNAGARIRGVKNLHSKMYLFGKKRAVVTSANLTEAGLSRNHEFGFTSELENIILHCDKYFDELWLRAGNDLSSELLEKMVKDVEKAWVNGARPTFVQSLPDYGTSANPSFANSAPASETTVQSFVKFSGGSDNRASRELTTFAALERSGLHWACSYPEGKRPRIVKNGAIMFMSRMVKDPDDIIIYGRGIAIAHQEGRDDATANDLQLRDWKKSWSHYIRVHHTEFIAGTLANGISLNNLKQSLGGNSFKSTKDNAASGTGNTDPNKSYNRHPAVQLSEDGFTWLDNELDQAFINHGKISQAEMDKLDWPQMQL